MTFAAASPVCRAADQVSVDMILPSGMVVADSRFDCPAPARSAPPAPTGQWVLTPGVIARLHDDRLTLAFDVLPDAVGRDHGRVVVSRTRRTVEIEGDARCLDTWLDAWAQGIDPEAMGLRWGELARVVTQDLIGWEALTPAEGARPRQAHAWSMRGAGAQTLLTPDRLAALTFDPPGRIADGAWLPLAAPDALPDDSLSSALRHRRSPTRYAGRPVSLEQLGQWLGRACGITGELAWGERRLGLRAYPSPGALYGVDVCVIAHRVDGLETGAYRYDPARHALQRVHGRAIDPADLCLPDTRPIAAGAAAFIALTIRLSRVTPKYADVSYRILMAEAGCIVQNLLLVAQAQGLSAGPFTGVFDALVDQAIETDGTQEHFVLGVLLGHGAP
ncbi:SagB/ThcOx family dehydrogenase [Pseudoxanthomonas koreensis]|uniref:SagB/ThcOx family dehydrogenase n=1 Tax=Pseudoxanthomonas koreensis TaxID=266061 RepID=UPI0013914C4B|nr:SagB/ThcOx family dehydrogenase [Pseudoxanthomonas koreensis]KAF1694141.1 hypothetical protein CSC64_04720 [Pseudoxanthomonas koreensis]